MAADLSEAMRETALVMAGQLESERLVVSLAPSERPEIAQAGGMIRIVDGRNPEWYIRFCEDHPTRRSRPRRRRKHDTAIKRQDTLRGLYEIASGRADSEYAQRLLEYVEREEANYRQEFGL